MIVPYTCIIKYIGKQIHQKKIKVNTINRISGKKKINKNKQVKYDLIEIKQIKLNKLKLAYPPLHESPIVPPYR